MAKLINMTKCGTLSSNSGGGCSFYYNENYNKEYGLEKKYIVIGRKHPSDIILSHPCVSRIHCFVLEHGGNYYLGDLRSTYGTWYPVREEGFFVGKEEREDKLLPRIIQRPELYKEIVRDDKENGLNILNKLFASADLLIEKGIVWELKEGSFFGIHPHFRFRFVR